MKRKKVITVGTMVMILCGTIFIARSSPEIMSTNVVELDESQLISKDEYKEMNKIIADYNQGLIPESELAKAEKLLKKHPELKYKNLNLTNKHKPLLTQDWSGFFNRTS